jgi:uncharacterized delta-60 repeat protein
MKLSIRASLAVVLVACFGCSSSGGTSSGEKLQPAPVATISVSPSAASLESGKTQQMSAVAKDAAGNVLSGVSFSWQSDATAVASVDGSGLVTGALVGTAHITASAQGVSGGADVSVKTGALAHIEISPAGGTVIVGQDLALGALASDAAGNPISGSAFKWTSDNPEVGKVDPATGIASGVAAAGENAAQAHIKASSSGIDSAAVTLTVKPIPIGSITVTPGSSTIHVGKTLQLRAAATDLDRAPLPGVSFTWESDNEAVAIVDANGLVTGVASGTAHFTAFAGRSPKVISNAATLTVNVLSVSVDPPAVSLSPGAGTQFGAKLANVISNSSVTWSVQEALGGTIDASGKYNAPCRAGPFHVVATSVEDPGKSAIATVTIARPRSGTLDSCFNGTGKLTTFLGGPAAANAMVRQPDGKIVVVGKVTPKDSTHSNFVVVRYTQEGSLDEKFGDGDGFVMTDFGIASEAFAVALQLDGKEQKIVVAGAAGSSFGIARYHQDGKPDTSFNPTAKVSGTRMDAVGFCG